MPAHFANGVIIVRMSVPAGRGIDLALDTGAGVNFMDMSVAESLSDKATRGAPFVIDDSQFGDATLHNIRFVSGPFYRRYDNYTEIVGILGYDFLKTAVVKIDYEHETVTIIDQKAFTPPAGAAVLAMDPASRVPIVAAKIGNLQGSSFIVDSGASTVVVLPRFAKADPEIFSSAHELKDDPQTVYYRLFWPLCGEVQENPYAVPQVMLGSLGVHDWTVWEPDEKSCFAPEGVDGLIGYDILRLFNVYIDYPTARVVLEPNSIYKTASNTIKP